MNRRCIRWAMFVFCFFMGQCILHAQQAGPTTLSGKMNIQGAEPLQYRLTLNISGNKVKGVSVTTQGGVELKAKVTGIINKEKKALIIAETEPIGKLSDSMEMCFFNSILKWKVKQGKYIVSGAFVGKDKKGNLCSQGTVELEAPAAECAAFRDEAKPAKKDAIAAIPILSADEHKITEGVDKRIEWGTEACTLDVWDNGIEDGDVVTIQLNGKDILTNYKLTSEKKRISVTLTEKVNTITVVAGDEGVNPPNTAQMVLTDGDIQHRVTAHNKKGKTASVVITKK